MSSTASRAESTNSRTGERQIAMVSDELAAPRAGAANIADTIDLPVGATATCEILGTVAASPGIFANSATIEPPADALDTVAANDSATATVVVFIFADRFESGDIGNWSATVPPP